MFYLRFTTLRLPTSSFHLEMGVFERETNLFTLYNSRNTLQTTLTMSFFFIFKDSDY